MRIALSGKMASGKSTIAKELSDKYGYYTLSIGSEIKPLALDLVTNREKFENRLTELVRDKKEYAFILHEVYDYFDTHFQNAVWEWDGSHNLVKNNDYRKLLQEIPMLIRNHLGNEIFLKRLLERNKTVLSRKQDIVIDDLRFTEEKQLLEKHNFITLRLDISEEEQMKRIARKYGKIKSTVWNHPSETALDQAVFDLRIDVTQRTVPSLVWEVCYMVKKINSRKEKLLFGKIAEL